MPAILAIDAAWTNTQPSGIALVVQKSDGWHCVAVAPSYGSFLDLAEGEAVPWGADAIHGGAPDPSALLDASTAMAGQDVTLVTVDMPVSTAPIAGRRAADQAISDTFGNKGCSTHSPSDERPGEVGRTFYDGFVAEGFSLATTATEGITANQLAEVYPHPALLTLLDVDYRVPYKISKALKYWPKTAVPQRIGSLITVYGQMLAALKSRILNVDLVLPGAGAVPTLSQLKRYEDALDALVCAWVGTEYCAGHAVPYGDSTAAIWVPSDT